MTTGTAFSESLESFASIVLSPLGLLMALLGGVLGFILFWGWWLEDARVQREYKAIYTLTRGPSYGALEAPPPGNVIVTSTTSKGSQVRRFVLKAFRRLQGKKPTIVIVHQEDTEEEKRRTLFRETARRIPGLAIFDKTLAFSIVQYIAYKLSADYGDEGNSEYFQRQLEGSKWLPVILKLDSKDLARAQAIIGDPVNSVLGEVLLPFAKALIRCIIPSLRLVRDLSGLLQKRQLMMPLVWHLAFKRIFYGRMGEADPFFCESAVRGGCSETQCCGFFCYDDVVLDLQAFSYKAWKIDEILRRSWRNQPYLRLYPKAAIPDSTEEADFPPDFLFAYFIRKERVQIRQGPF